MQTALRAAALLLAAGVIGGVVFILAPDRVNDVPTEEKQEKEQIEITETMEKQLELISTAFENGSTIPSKYTCDEDNINPPLSISGVPDGAVSLALIMDDPDIPQQFKDERGIDSFDHWTVYGISSKMTSIAEGVEPQGSAGINGRGNTGYTGPCPPPEFEPTEHRYFFKLYALDSSINFVNTPTKNELLSAMEGHIISQTELVGLYDRSDSASE